MSNVDAWNASNAWAVGRGDQAGFAIHWNGTTWTKVGVPLIGQHSLTEDVAMAGPHDVWAFGEFTNARGRIRSLALHRTGSSWVRVVTPNIGKGENDLFSADVIAPDDIWAAGTGTVGGAARALVAHWNGLTWKRLDFPLLSDGNNYLEGVTAVGPGDVWVAVNYPDPDTGKDRLVTYHRAGGVWHRVDLTQPSDDAVEARDILAFGPSSIFMVGFYVDSGHYRGLIERWNGSHWVRFPGQNPAADTYLERVTGFGPQGVYAVGVAGTNTFVEHFDGGSWQQVTTNDPAGAQASALYGVGSGATGSDHRIWGVGWSNQPAGDRQSLVEQSCPS